MSQIWLSDFLITFLEKDSSKGLNIVYRIVGVQLKEAIKTGEVNLVLPDGYYTVSDGNIVKVKEPRKNNKGLLLDYFLGDLLSFENWFELPKHLEPSGFLSQTKQKKIRKPLTEMNPEELQEAYRELQAKLNRVAKPRAKRTKG